MVSHHVYISSTPLSCIIIYSLSVISDREADDARRQSLVELEQQQDAQLVQAQIVSAFMQAHARAQAHSHSGLASSSSSQSASAAAAASSAAFGKQTSVGGSDGGEDDDFQRALQMSLMREDDQKGVPSVSAANLATLSTSLSSSAPSSATSSGLAIQSAEAAAALESGILASVMRDSQRALLDSLPKAVQFVHLNMKYGAISARPF
jgi:hypothetical protein